MQAEGRAREGSSKTGARRGIGRVRDAGRGRGLALRTRKGAQNHDGNRHHTTPQECRAFYSLSLCCFPFTHYRCYHSTKAMPLHIVEETGNTHLGNVPCGLQVRDDISWYRRGQRGPGVLPRFRGCRVTSAPVSGAVEVERGRIPDHWVIAELVPALGAGEPERAEESDEEERR